MKVNWKKLFDWTVISVAEPEPSYYDYADRGRMHIGYEVKVTYLHHGEFRAFFGIDRGKFCLCNQGAALRKAKAYYKNKLVKTKNENSK